MWSASDGTVVESVNTLDADSHRLHRYRIRQAGALLAEFGTLHEVADYLSSVG